MNNYWSNTLKQIEPYVPGEQPQGKRVAKLNTNESPYPPSPRVIEAIQQATNDDLRLYPDPNCIELRNTVASYYGINAQQVFIGNGSDEILAFCYLAFFNPQEYILFPDITYSFYPVYSKLFNIPYKEVRLNDDFSVPIQDFLVKNHGIIIPNPNAPTGRCLDVNELIPVVKYNYDLGKVVIIDEAYIDFGGTSLISFITEFPNLLIVQTLSKSRCLAGLRIGLAIGSEGLVDGLVRIKDSINSYTLDRLSLIGAREAFKDEQYFQSNREKIIATRERVTTELIQMGFDVIPSKANFLFVAHKSIPAIDLFAYLKDCGIYVRHFQKPRIENYLRISIGTDSEMDQLLKAIEERERGVDL
jgi:histidinol-phosphate aminotransferase